jgi:hypothetical protein
MASAETGFYYNLYANKNDIQPIAQSSTGGREISGIPAPTTTDTVKYYVSRVSASSSSSSSSCESERTEVKVTVKAKATADMITAAGITICHGETAYLEASAPSVTYPTFTWYDADGNFLSTGPTFETPSLNDTTKYYVSVYGETYCENDPTARKEVTVTVPAALTGGTINAPTPSTICSGITPETLGSAAGAAGGKGDLSYRWQQSDDGEHWSDIDGDAGSATYQPAALEKTTSYRRLATNDCGTDTSNVVTLTVNPTPKAPTVYDVTACYDGTPHTGIAVSYTGEEIVWYKEATGNEPAVPSRLEIGMTTAYAAARNRTTGCESTRVAVKVEIIDCFSLVNDTRTVQKYRWVEVDVLANDILPEALFSGAFSLVDSIEQQPRAGTLTAGRGAGRGSTLFYANDRGLTNLTSPIDSFIYRIRSSNGEYRATAYIYILNDRRGAAACKGESYTAMLDTLPTGVDFEWLATADRSLLARGPSYPFGVMQDDSVRLVKPVNVLPADAGWNRDGGFPPGEFTVHAFPATGASMRWTGLIDTAWYNPANWVERVSAENGNYETSVSWTPTHCVDVTLPSGLPHYPELTDSAWCSLITVQDRAMLKNPHVLTHRRAQVELRLKTTERDRFVMWSAPLTGMYSGDYHFRNGNEPVWGDVAMNFFQQTNPDVDFDSRGVALKNTFTATFGNPGVPLPLGMAFNLKVTSTTRSREQTWIFPQTDTEYWANGVPYSVPRDGDGKLISAVPLDPDTTFALPVPEPENPSSGNAGFDLVQVVNPYLAWLDVDKFVKGNGALTNGYLIWDGSFDSSFDAVEFGKEEGNGYSWSTAPNMQSPTLVPPLQSFFVQKKEEKANESLKEVRMSPNWTTTSNPAAPSYVLRSGAANPDALRIKAVQGSRTAYALLRYDPQATPGYNSFEDIRPLFYDELPLTVYTLTALREPLLINISGSFETRETPWDCAWPMRARRH